MPGKLIIVAAPSGAGKTTIVKHLLATIDELAFSVSAATRACRAHETDGKDYYFMSAEKFRDLVAHQQFVEWEEVYDDQYYGTLKSEIERLWALGKSIIFDIDVKGAMSIKQQYPNESITIFVKPPSKEILFERLRNRKTETPESLRKRINRAAGELEYEPRFEAVVVNDVLKEAFVKAEEIVHRFLAKIV